MAELNNQKYRPEFCELLLEHMKMGKSYDSFPAAIYLKYKIMVGISALYDWETRYPEFGEAKSIAVQLALNYYETRVTAKTSGQKIEGINPKDIDAYVLMGMLKTRFYKIYGDKARVEHDVPEETKNELRLAYSIQNK
jgi:hypothetical protein